MSPQEHYREAERLLYQAGPVMEKAAQQGSHHVLEMGQTLIAKAQVHATLSTVPVGVRS